MKFRMWYVLFFALLFLGLSGCAGTGFIASPAKSATNQDTLKLAKPVSPSSFFVNGAIAAGKSLKYKVVEVDRLSNTVSFDKTTNFTASVQLLLQSDGQTVGITVTVKGNSSEAGQVETVKIIADFKAELTKQFAN